MYPLLCCWPEAFIAFHGRDTCFHFLLFFVPLAGCTDIFFQFYFFPELAKQRGKAGSGGPWSLSAPWIPGHFEVTPFGHLLSKTSQPRAHEKGSKILLMTITSFSSAGFLENTATNL